MKKEKTIRKIVKHTNIGKTRTSRNKQEQTGTSRNK